MAKLWSRIGTFEKVFIIAGFLLILFGTLNYYWNILPKWVESGANILALILIATAVQMDFKKD
jgi:hypothetical protein